MEYNTKEEIAEALKASKALLVFSADWCGPCKTFAPTIDGLKSELDFPVVRINVDENGELAEKYGIRGIPTTVCIRDEEWKSLVGVNTAEELKEFTA